MPQDMVLLVASAKGHQGYLGLVQLWLILAFAVKNPHAGGLWGVPAQGVRKG